MPGFTVKPDLLRWAIGGSGRGSEYLHEKFQNLKGWIGGDSQPTLAQLKKFAKATHVPIGYLFFNEPPEERLPMTDMRTKGNREIKNPTRDLLDTIHLCQIRQDWYRDFSEAEGKAKHPFVGSTRLNDDIEKVAVRMRRALGFSLKARAQFQTWENALQQFIQQAEDLGVLVMVSGVVGNNPTRKLDPEEFRGFALCDDLAPLVFINGADTKAAQTFTLAHELAHIWLGKSGLSNVSVSPKAPAPRKLEEKWCNQVAAELLVPLSVLRAEYRKCQSIGIEQRLELLAQRFKVSKLVILRRLYDAKEISREEQWEFYKWALARLRKEMARTRKEMARQRKMANKGGDFYLIQAKRASTRFASALLASTFNGQTSFTEASCLLGIRKIKTLRAFATKLGIDA